MNETPIVYTMLFPNGTAWAKARTYFKTSFCTVIHVDSRYRLAEPSIHTYRQIFSIIGADSNLCTLWELALCRAKK